ncbi:MAG: BrnA antitoxin family protein [bacterium]|nr:BrnA antitoxin family protein [bacterium]
MNKKIKAVPKFKSEKAERKFWQRVDSTEYVDYSKMEKWSFPNLKLTSKPITIRLPRVLIDRVKIKANQRALPYQSLIKQFIYEGLANV